MPKRRENDPVLRNLVRMHAYEYLLAHDRMIADAFMHLFAVWSPRPGNNQSGDRHPVHRLCDYLWDHFTDDLDRTPPPAVALDAVYLTGETAHWNGREEFAEGAARAAYRTDRPIESLEDGTRRLAEAGLVGDSLGWGEVLRDAARAIGCRLTVLIEGEVGVGKRRLARIIHRLSGDPDASLIFVPAGDLTADAIGHRLVWGGTLVLVEVADLELAAQKLLADILREELAPGSSRVIATNSLRLEELTAARLFDRELFHRLALVPIHLPPLRQRLDDIPVLAAHFIRRFRDANRSLAASQLSPAALERLRSHLWPGNLRELQAVVARALLICREEEIRPEHIVFAPDAGRAVPLKEPI